MIQIILLGTAIGLVLSSAAIALAYFLAKRSVMKDREKKSPVKVRAIYSWVKFQI